MLVGFGCHYRYSLTAMNWLQKSPEASCQAGPIPDSSFELWILGNRWLCFTVSYAQTFMQTIYHIWRCPAEHLPNALVAHAGCFKHANTPEVVTPVCTVLRAETGVTNCDHSKLSVTAWHHSAHGVCEYMYMFCNLISSPSYYEGTISIKNNTTLRSYLLHELPSCSLRDYTARKTLQLLCLGAYA